jgi:DNA helicase MCM8
MEQQTISIAKGGIMGSLSARCAVVAAANPPSGHYNRSRTIIENIRVSNAILSRFDMVFLLLDDPDLQRDKKLSEHVMKLHSRNRKRNLNMFEQGQDQPIPN